LGTEMETVSALLRVCGVSFAVAVAVVVVITPSCPVVAFGGDDDGSGGGLGGIRANPSCEPVVCRE
jgi:hypothetical protein